MKPQKVLFSVLISILVGLRANVDGSDVQLRIETSPRIYYGLPVYLSIQITNAGDKAIEFPEFYPYQTNMPLTLQLHDVNDEAYTSSVNFYGFIMDEVDTSEGPMPIWKLKWRLIPHESRRCLANLGPAIEQLKIPEGEYKLSVRLWEKLDEILVESPRVQVVVANGPKSAALASMTKSTPLTARGLGDIKVDVPIKDIKALPTKELQGNIAMSMLLYQIHATKQLADVPIEDYLPLIDPIFAPEMTLWEYEIAMARKNQSKADALKKALLEQSPAMKSWIEQAERGEVYFHAIRRGG